MPWPEIDIGMPVSLVTSLPSGVVRLGQPVAGRRAPGGVLRFLRCQTFGFPPHLTSPARGEGNDARILVY
jgi:hypothetical protein